ncbi:LysE family transporter [Rheinheimera sp. F8]|uniref:LysE/ArgO family amino acid transporter n=1 Tax=Rheinheimera sp. F8 TaxID=1763998 RepID=UPI000744889C|nr:LysE family transporter [Rheinheimera sp. F8]ALZ75744.1 lysine transporter LysE [Rheinheimera sp. F8]
MWSFFTGFSVGLSLIVAIGGQNIWVLSQSMAGANRLVIATVCILCDALLIVAGVSSIATLQRWIPPLVPLLTVAGVLLLLYLAFGAAKRAWQGNSGLNTDAQVQLQSSGKTALTALAITLLNPHVYLDTVVLLGSLGNAQPSPFWFTVGACLASFCWFSALTGFAPKLKLLLSSPLRWRLFDGSVALLLSLIAIKLAL